MKCENRNREEKITLYIDRQLDWKEEKEFLKHIRECPECKRELQQAQKLRKMLLDMPMEEVPEGLHENIMKSIEKEIKKSPAKKRIAWQKYGALVACFFLLVIAGKQLFQKTENTTETADISMYLEDSEIEEPKEAYPIITQKRSANAPETSKALPATPSLATGDTKKEAEEQNENIEDLGNEVSSEAVEEIENVLSQPVSEGESIKDDEKEEEKEDVIEGEEKTTNTTKRSVSVNMKSRSLQIQLKTKDINNIVKNIEKRTKDLKGEIETPYLEGSMTIKVPILEYNNVVNWLGQQCEVVDKNEIIEDLAKQYKEIQQQADNAKEKEKEAIKKEQSRKAQEARKTQKECETALEELKKTAEFAVIHILFVE